MKIGSKLIFSDSPVLLAPMEDVTDRSFRSLCREFGADMTYTEFVNSDALVRSASKSLDKLVLDGDEHPVGAQIYGNDVESMARSAVIAAECGPDLIDINFGCPVRKIAGRGAGSGMMRNVPLMVEITRRVVEAVDLPVTVKTRLGWDEESKNIEEIAERLQDVGISALTIHGRTRAQMYKGEADWSLIGAVKNNPRITIPIIGNGDIVSARGAALAFERYGVDAIMVGRATFGRPWIFRDIRHYLETGEQLLAPSVEERVAISRRHLGLSVGLKGERVGVLEMRRHFSCYFKGFPDFRDLRIGLVTSPTVAELELIFDTILERYSGYDATVLPPVSQYD